MKTFALALLLAFAAVAQTTTTVTDTLTDPTGGHPNGTCSFQNARRFVAGNGWNVIGVPRVASFTAGALSVALVPTDGALSAGPLFYQKTCRAPLQTPGGASCEADPSLVAGGTCTVGPYTWGPTYFQVPVSASPVPLANIESDAVPPPGNAQWRGVWSSTATYRLGDIVVCPVGSACGALSPGAAYISNGYANVGNDPSTSPSWWTATGGEWMAKVLGTGVVRLVSGIPGLVPGSAKSCVKVDGTSAPCLDTSSYADGYYCEQVIAGVPYLAQGSSCPGGGGGGGGTITINGQSCTTGSSCTVADSTKVPTTTTVNGHALSSNVSVTASDVGLGSVTNDAQTKASIVPNTAPSPGEILVGNAGGTAYAKVPISGACTMTSGGVMTCSGGSGVLADFAPTKTSSTVVTVAGGKFRYGTNITSLSGSVTFTIQTIAISSIVTDAVQTTINTAAPVTALVEGQAINVQLIGIGAGCAAGTGVFVATRNTTSSFYIAADTSAGCTLTSGTVGAQTGGTAIIFGNTAGQVEMSHSAAMGALVLASGTGAVATQTATGAYPNGSVPFGYATITAGAFDTLTDQRAALGNMQVQSGAGIDVTPFGGQVQISTASNIPKTDAPSVWLSFPDMHLATKTAPFRTGTGSPNARDNCSYVGEMYARIDSPAICMCTTAGTPGTWGCVGGFGGIPANAMTYNSVPMTYNGVVMTYN